MWIDTHAHLHDERLAGAIDAMLERAQRAKVEAIITIGLDVASSREAVRLAERHAPIFAAVGIHPNHTPLAEPGDWERILDLLDHPKVVAVGETGMDRYWNDAPIELQRSSFVRHLEVGQERRMPVVIHCRQAESDVLDALRQVRDPAGMPLLGVMHSFTGDRRMAESCLEMGLFISFAGMVTYKKNEELRKVAKSIPDDRILVETDSPYLSPEPVRGKTNEPAHVTHTGLCLARVRETTDPTFARLTTGNARGLFGIEPVFAAPADG